MRKILIAALVGLGLTTYLTATAASYTSWDVSTPNSSATVNGATFNYANPQPTGTGFIDPFLREQNTGVEFGVNTDIKAQTMNNVTGTGIFYGNKDPINFTHDEAISSLTTINGNYRFFLDVNQVGNGPISLTTLKIFASDTRFTDATALQNFLATATPAYNLNAGVGGNVKPNQVIVASDSGSGSGDMYVDVPAFGTQTQWLYLLAGFGEQGSTYAANDGFEEWWTRTSTPPPPVPDSASALSLLGIAITGIEIFRRKFRA